MTVAAVVIGRNEGARLIDCLDALKGQVAQIIYVDSGSTDGSVEAATQAGAEVIALDMTQPFTAARARNAGFDALDAPEYVQFIDGDCSLVPGFIDAASAFLDANPRVGMVTGWRSEIHRNASMYNQLCDFEWRRPAGVIDACGGDMMVRAALWREVGGMNPEVIAAEDDEVCCRFRKAGWTLERIPHEMTRHDANMLRFGQWWSRAVRTGHGFAQVGHLHPEYFTRERKRVLVYGLALPVLMLIGLTALWWLVILVLAAYVFNYIRTARGLMSEGLIAPEAWRHAMLLSLSKFPNLIGMARFYWRHKTQAQMRIIEYK